MLNILFYVVIWLLGFVCGVLLGRSNKKKVEAAYNDLKERYNNLVK
jgi:hypothetical protein